MVNDSPDYEIVDEYPGTNKLTAQIAVHNEDGEWIDFFATFTKTRISGDNEWIADWDSLRRGNGVYVDETPPFWPVQEAAKGLDKKYELRTFTAINSGPNDR